MIVFFDADGTILDIKKGVAKDVKPAIEALHRNGHKAVLCTGRSRAFIPQEVEELGLDGMICNLGGFISYGDKILYDKELPAEAVNRSIRVLRECGLIPVLEGNGYMYFDKDEYNTSINWYVDLMIETLGDKLLPIKGNEGNIHINKISAKKVEGCDYEKACRELSDIYDYIFHEGAFVGSTIECVAKGHSKGLAIAILTQVLGYTAEDSVVFGDSNNDLSMFEVAGHKVAMGDASDELKSVADYVTFTMAEGGISNGLHKLGLI